MPLLPNASVKTKYDFTRSRFEWKRQFEVSPLTNIVEEGSMLTRLTGPAGTEVVQLAASGAFAADEALAGLALSSRITAVTFTDVREYTIPAAPGPYTIQLPHAGLVNVGAGVGELYAVASVTGALTTVAGGAPAGGQVGTNVVSGLLTFNVAQAGEDVTITYRWNLLATERDLILRQSQVNRGAEDQFGLMTVGYGNCTVYSTMYVAGVAYAVGDQLYTINGGLVSSADPGAGVAFGRVVSPPSPGDPYLGFEYNSAQL